MKKSELVNAVSQRTGLSRQDAALAVNSTLEVIAQALSQGDRVQLSGFGVFEVRQRAGRVGRNPQTKETMDIPAASVPVFQASPALRDTVAGKKE